MKGKKQLLAFLSAAMVMQTIPNAFLQIHAKVLDENKELNLDNNNIYDSVLQYWSSELIGEMKGLENDKDLQSCVKKLDEKAQNYLDTMLDPKSNEHLWNDKAYNDAEVGAKATESLDRLKMIAIQTLEPTSALYRDDEALAKVIEGLKFVLNKKYGPDTPKGSSNWWDWEIGAPKSLVDLGILYYDKLDEKVIYDITKTIDRFVPKADYRLNSSLKETGANLVDKVAIVIKRAALDGNEERMSHAKKCMAPLFSYSNSGDGYYPDGSFIQHGNIPYNGSYGYVLLNELTNCIIMLSFTDYKIDTKDIEFYENTLLNHYIPFISYGGNMVDSVRGRAVSRKAQQGDTMGMQTMGVLLQYADIAATEQTKNEIYKSLKGIAEQKFSEDQTQDFSLLAYSDYIRVKNLAENDLESAMERNTYNVYSYMDRIVSNRDSYTFTVAANSSRMCTEQGNSENILGRYQGQGYTQIYNNDINQYNEDYNATVDQKRLSGVTTAHQDLGFLTSGQSKWSGGSTLDGKNGVSGFELTGEKQLTELKGGFGSESDTGVKSGITANKSYFVFGNKIVYLGSNINNLGYDDKVDFVESIVENRKAFDGMNLTVDGNSVVNTNGATSITNPKSAYLSGKTADTGIGYVFLEDMNIDIKRETRNATWNDVNKLAKFTDYTPVSNDFISMAVNHGTTPKEDTYSWIVMPNASKEDIKEYQENPTIEVIENSENIQAVKDKETNQSAYNFFGAGETNDKTISVSGSASIVMQENKNGFKLAVSDPTRSQSFVDVTLKGVKNLKHVGIVEGSADIVSVDGDSVTIRVNFSSKDGQPRKIEVGTVYETTTENLALNKKSEASSVVQNSATLQRTPNFAVDGKTDTRWASNYERSEKPISKEEADTGWFAVDLGKLTTFNQVKISWEWALSNDFEIQVSNDEETEDWDEKEWKTVASVKENTGYKEEQRKDDIQFEEVNARYVRIKSNNNSRPLNSLGEAAGGLSIYEFEVYSSINLVRSVEKAEKLLKDYPEAKAFDTPELYVTLKTNLENALQNAKSFKESGSDYDEKDLQKIASELENASKEFDNEVLHVTEITIDDKDIPSLDKGEERQLSTTISPSNAYNKDVEWTSSNRNVATVDENGVVRGLSSGETVITVTSKDNGLSDSITITVKVKPQSITLDKKELEMKKGETTKITATISPVEASGSELLYATTNKDVVEVDGNGNVKAVGVGEVDIVVSSVENPKVVATCHVKVKANLVVSSDNLALADGRKTSASSTVSAAGVTPDAAVDGKYDTRWASNYEGKTPPITAEEAEKQWWMLELPESITFNHIDITWFSDTVYGKEFKILVSEDGNTWKEAYYETDGKNKKYGFDFNTVSGRFIKFQGIKRTATGGGYGIVEFEIYNKMDYDKIITEAKNILNLYPSEMTGKQAEYDKLKNAVEASERLIEENPNFTQDELRKVLSEVDNAMSKYKEFIVPVTGIKGSEMTLLAGKEGKLTYEITPENATNKEVFLDNENPEIVSLEKDGTVHALKKGTAKVIVTTKDGEHQAEVLINVKSNTPPTINASDVTIKVGSEFNPLKYASAVDEEDGEIKLTKENIIKNTVDPSKEGKGIVTYRVTDKDGNSVEKTINVTVENSVVVDKTDLNKAIKEARSIETSKYTEESVKAFEDALTKAEAVSKDDKATQEDVDSAEKALTEAIKNLVEKEEPSQPVEADKSGLKDIIDSVKGVDTGNYTEESVKELTEALSKAEGVLADKDATQEEVDKVTKELTEAYKNLEKKEVEEPATGDTGKEEDKKDDEKENSKDEVKTGVASPAGALAATAGLALAGAIVVAKKKREE